MRYAGHPDFCSDRTKGANHCELLVRRIINHVWDEHKYRSEREMDLYVNG